MDAKQQLGRPWGAGKTASRKLVLVGKGGETTDSLPKHAHSTTQAPSVPSTRLTQRFRAKQSRLYPPAGSGDHPAPPEKIPDPYNDFTLPGGTGGDHLHEFTQRDIGSGCSVFFHGFASLIIETGRGSGMFKPSCPNRPQPSTRPFFP